MRFLHFLLLLVAFGSAAEMGSVGPHRHVTLSEGRPSAIYPSTNGRVEHSDIALVKAVNTFFIGTGIIGRNKYDRTRTRLAADIRVKGRDNQLFRGLIIDPQLKLPPGSGEASIILNNALHNPKRLLLKSKNKDCVKIASRALRTHKLGKANRTITTTNKYLQSPFVLDLNALSLLASRCNFDTSRRYQSRRARRNRKRNVNRRENATKIRPQNAQKAAPGHSDIQPPNHRTFQSVQKHINAPSSYAWYDSQLPFGFL